jgi:hypothetical protein
MKPTISMLCGISDEDLRKATSSRTDCSRFLKGRKAI